MSAYGRNLHGDAPARSTGWALLLIDFINDLDFEGGAELLPAALEAARAAAALRRRAREAGVSVIYVNDNFQRWRSDFRQVVRHCGGGSSRGSGLVRLLEPDQEDYFVLKPSNSGFFHTPLQLLLRHLEANRLILAGLTADNCVMYTASDAYLHGFQLYLPVDCVASIVSSDKEAALEHMRKVLKARLTDSSSLDFGGPSRPPRRGLSPEPGIAAPQAGS